MRITCNTSGLQKQLEQIRKEVTRKLKAMVVEFAYNVSLSAVANTPLGDSITYRRYYEARQGLPQIEGLARGNWQYSESTSGVSLKLIAGLASGEAASDGVAASAGAYYKLGDTFYIGNAAPYISALENNYSRQTQGQGISQPTLNTVMQVYSFRLDDYYKQG